MKMKRVDPKTNLFSRTLLALAIGSAGSVYAGEAAFFLTENEMPANDVAVQAGSVKKMANAKGVVRLDLPAGSHTVEFSRLGESLGSVVLEIADAAQRVDVKVEVIGGEAVPEIHPCGQAGQEPCIEIAKPAASDEVIEELVAVGSYTPETMQTAERDAGTVLEAIGKEQMERFGDSSVASALQRMAGVSVVGGEFAVVRGLQGRYVAATLDKGLIPSTDPLRRDVPLDLFPDTIIEGITISKGYTPDLPGDSTGGAINMQTRGMPKEEFTAVGVGMGWIVGLTGKDVVSYEGGGSDWTGTDDGTREMPTSLDSTTDFGSPGSLGICSGSFCDPDDLSPAEAAALGKSLENIYNIEETRANPNIGFSVANASLWSTDRGDIGLYGALEYDSGWKGRQDAEINDVRDGKYEYERSQNYVDVAGYVTASFSDNESEYSAKTIWLRKSDDITRVQQGVDIEGVDKKDVILQWTERQYLGQLFSGKNDLGDGHSLDWHIGFAQTERNQPDRRSYQFRNGIANPLTVERRYSEMTEDSVDLRFDYQFDAVRWSDLVSTKLKTGIYSASKERENKLARIGFNQNNLNTAGLDFEQVMSPANFDSGSIVIRVNTSNTDYYDATDDITALYLMGDTAIGESVNLLAGVRHEEGEQTIEYPFSAANRSAYDTSENLPMLAATWRPTEEWQLRAGWSKTLSRPGIVERSESQMYDPDTDDRMRGNPNLVISNIDNLDLRAEYYFSDEDSISLALFHKNIDAPIEKTKFSCSGSACDGYTFENQDEATVSGIEMDFRYGVIDSADWSGFVGGNL
jgi:outer membrane receptor protein involved in Fe transport